MSEPHMDPETFRRWGHAMVDWIADYQRRVEGLPVASTLEPGDVRAGLPEHPPEHPERFDAILRDIDERILPGITHWQSPNFFAYFPANSSGPAILGELLSAGLGVQGMMWSTSPACTELETLMLDWLVELLDLPPHFLSNGPGGGTLQDSASSSCVCALIAARERLLARHPDDRQSVLARATFYTSDQAHSSIEKAVRILGFSREQLRCIATDSHGRMRTSELENAILADLETGRLPCFVCATLGTTGINAFDSLTEVARAMTATKAWLHVDAAMAGPAAICNEYRSLFDGLEHADSYTFNPHKWLFTNFDCNCLYLADRSELINALAIHPEYLKNEGTQSGRVIDYRDWQIPLGRRFRALKLWFVLRSFGRSGLQSYLQRHVKLAQDFADRVREHPRLELIVEPPLNLVCFRHVASQSHTRELLRRINVSGKLHASHCEFAGNYVIRFCVGQTRTREEHVQAAWQLIAETESALPLSPTALDPA